MLGRTPCAEAAVIPNTIAAIETMVVQTKSRCKRLMSQILLRRRDHTPTITRGTSMSADTGCARRVEPWAQIMRPALACVRGGCWDAALSGSPFGLATLPSGALVTPARLPETEGGRATRRAAEGLWGPMGRTRPWLCSTGT